MNSSASITSDEFHVWMAGFIAAVGPGGMAEEQLERVRLQLKRVSRTAPVFTPAPVIGPFLSPLPFVPPTYIGDSFPFDGGIKIWCATNTSDTALLK